MCHGLAQAASSPNDDNSTNQLSVLLWAPKTDFHAPATIDVVATVQVFQAGLKAGDTVHVDFFEHATYLGSGKTVWHGVIRPHVPPGSAMPMWVRPAGFDPVEYIWKNVPAGNYALRAKAMWGTNVTAISSPLDVHVLPQ